MSNARLIADHIERIRPQVKSGTLRFFGDWFGKPYDNIHTITRAVAEEDRLDIIFDKGEILSVWNPDKYQIDANSFRISSASRVLWQWYYYGRPHFPENLYHSDYRIEGDKIDVKTNVDFYEPQLHPTVSEPAVAMY